MTDFRKSEKLLKHHLKKKKNITLALIVAFLISGVPFFEEELNARDLRVRNKESNSVRPDSGGPTLNESANGTQVVDIVKANENGISHNKFIDLSVGAGNGLIFNNSTEHGVSQIGGYVTKNANLDKSASVILNEVTGNRVSNINGSVEVFGQKADFILANENGINVNGATFINTSGVTLTTGKVTVEDSAINFDVQKGNIKLNGVGTSGDYFNILAKTIEIHKEISPIDGEKTPDISLIAGENILRGKKDNLKDIEIVSSRNARSDKYGIYATELGAMYGNNIRLISTDKGLGVRHEGVIFSKEDIEIMSNGDITLKSLNSGRNLKITGDNLNTLDGIVSTGESNHVANISAEKDIEFKINDTIKLKSGVQSIAGNIKITAKDLTLVDKTSARIIAKNSVVINLSNKFDIQGVMIPTVSGVDSSNLIILVDADGTLGAKDIKTGKIYSSKDITWVSTGIFGENVEVFTKELENSGVISANKTLKIDAEKITNNYKGLFKGADLNIRAKSLFVNKGDIRENQKDLNEFVDPNGKLKIEVTLGGFENYGNISSKNIDILTQKLLNSLTGKIMATDGNIIITTTVGELINYGDIFTDKNLTLLSNENIINTGKIAGNNLTIEALKGNFLNAGYISSVNTLKIVVSSLTNAGSKEEIKKYLEMYSQYSESELQKVEKILATLEGKEQFKEAYNHFKELKATLLALKEELAKTGKLGVLDGGNISISTSNDVKNTGMVISQNDINIEAKNIENQGIVQGNGNIFLTAIEQIINGGRVTGQKDISITAQSYTSLGNTDTLSAYLLYLQKVDMKKLEELNNEISTLESQLSKETDKNKAKELIKRLNLLKNQKNEIEEAKNTLSTFENLGILEGNNIVITTINSLANNGVIISQNNLNLTSQVKIENSGVVSVGNDAMVKGSSFDSNSLTVGGDLVVETTEGMISNELIVGKDITISGGITSNGNLHGNGNLDISGNFSSSINSKNNIVGDINISGGVNSSGDISAGGNVNISGDLDFISNGELQVGKDLNISSKNVITNITTVGGSASITSKEDILNTGNFQAKKDITFVGNNISSNGQLVTEENLTINGSGNFSSEEISVGGKFTSSSQGFVNNKSVVVGQDTIINSGDGAVSTGDKIDINGELISNGIELNGKLNNSGNIQSKGDITISSDGNIDINDGGKLVATGDINIDITGDINNKGMIVGNQDINLEAKNIKNNDGSTIWANKNIVLEASEKIYNGILSTIQAMGDISLKAKEIENNAGTINSKGKMDIKTNSLINRSNVIEDIKIDGYTNASAVTRWDQIAFYHLDYVYVEIPNIVDNSYVKDRATISSGGDLSIEGDVLNHAGTIASSKNIDIVGNVTNTSHKKDISVEWLLENTKITLYWETKLYGGAHGNSGVKYRGNLKEALMIGVLNENGDKFYKSLTQLNNPVLEKALSTYLGANWKSVEKPVSQDKWNKNANFQYITANASGKILAGKNLTHSGGSFINDGGESGSNQNVSVDIGNDSVDGIVSNGSVIIKDINQIKEVDGVKQIHDVEIVTGEVTINGVTIKAESGNIAGSIAVAGTINPIIFIETPINSNGMFKPATPKPNGIQPIYETNIDFINPDNFYGSDYFFKQIGYDKNKTSSVIGDAYYEYILLTKMIQEGIGYTGDISAENIKALLDNALKVQEELNLEIGKPLTPDQISKLDKDIVWYVEMEVNGQRTLVPQIYFSNDSRVNIAQNQGNGGSSTVKVGGNFTTDNTEFSNTNGNIVANGNIIIKSEGDITNNSSGGVSGGITSQMGNVAVDAGGDVNLIGGSISGDNVLVSGNNINIEATLGTDENGNQIISDQGKISAENGIQIDAKNDINIKGGSLTASGVEIKPEEQEDSMGGGIEESKPEEEVKVKDVKYYEELFKKESADIIEGDAGTININAGGSVNIEDIYTVSSDRKQNNINDFNHNETVSAQAKSNGANIIGSNINISSEKDVNIKGSTIATNDVLEENKDKELVPGSINISAKADVNITDSKDVTYEKSNSVTTTVDKGLITVKWKDSEKSSSLSKGSSIITGGDFNISSGNNVKIQGSDITSLGDTNIDAKNDVEIVDGRDIITEKSTDGRYQVIGGGVTTSDIYSSKSVGSNLTTVGDLNISSGNNIKIVNGNLASTGDTKLKAENDISIEAGKNEYVEKTNSTNVGIYVDANAGIGGVGVSGSASTSDMSASGEVSSEWGAESQVSENLDGSNEKVPTTSGKPHMDQLINSEIGLKLENIRKETTETTWSESQLQGENISIEAGNTVDIGGGDYKATENINIKGKTVNTTKYEDSKTEKTDGFTFTVKQSQGVNSAIADTINTAVKMDSAIKAGNANEGVLAAQGIGAVSNIIFNDLAGVFSKQSIGLSVDKSTTTETSENITAIEGKNINITATDGDINLAGVDIKGEDNIALDAKKNINITAAKKTSTENGVKVDLEAQLEQTAGYSALWGGNTDVGVGGSVNVDVTQKQAETFVNSTISSNGNLTIKSGADTNIIGAEIEAKKDANIDVGGNLNIESKKSSYDEHSINANAGANVSIGGATNTIGKAEVGFNAGGGDIWKSGETVEQSGIKVGGNLNVSVKGDLNMTGGVLGSETGNGNLEVGGNLNIKDIVTKEQQGGAHITVSGGFAGDMGVDGTIGDEQNKQVTTKSAIGLNPDNIKVDGSVSINGENSIIDNINTDIENTQTVDYDIIKKGGDITLSGSLSNINDVKDLVNKVKNKVSSGSNNSNSGDSDSLRPNGDVNISNRGDRDDKYSVLDKDNAFDFPKDDGIRDSFVDRANESIIVPETSPKLDAEPPAYKEPPSYEDSIAKKNTTVDSEVNIQDKIENTIKDIGNLKDDISRVEKIESITGGDLGTKAVIEDLNSKLSKSQEDLNNLIKNVDKDNSQVLDKVAEGIEKNIEGLLDKQKEIADKATITDRDKDNLERIETQLKQNVEQLNGIIAKKDNEPQNGIVKKSEEKVEIYSKGNIQNGDVDIPKYNFTDKNIDQVIKKVEKELATIQKEQQKLIIKSELDNTGQYALDKTVDSLKDAIKDYINKNKDKKITDKQKEKIDKILEKFETYDRNNEKYLSGKPQEKEKVNDLTTVITRSDKDIRDNLQKVAEYSDKIPKEHLLDYLDRVIKNSDFEKVIDKTASGEPETILSNPTTIGHSEASEVALNKIYENILKNTDNSIRDDLDKQLVDRLSKDEDLLDILDKDTINKQELESIANKIQDIKAEIFEKVIGTPYEKVKIEVIEATSDSNLVGSNDGESLKIYVDDFSDMENVLQTIVHELTHQDQSNFKKNNPEGYEDLSKIYDLNSNKNGYITKNDSEYSKQPIEKEAINSEKVIDKAFGEDYIDYESGDEFDFSQNSLALLEKFAKEKEEQLKREQNQTEDKYAVLDKDNAFDFPQDNIERDSFVDRAGEDKISPEHYTPLEGNPEKYKEQNKSLAEKQDRLEKLKAEMEKEFAEANSRLDNLEKQINAESDELKDASIIEKEFETLLGQLENMNSKVDANIDSTVNEILAKNSELEQKLQDIFKKYEDKYGLIDESNAFDFPNLSLEELKVKEAIANISKKLDEYLEKNGHSSAENLNSNIFGKDKIVDNSKYDILNSDSAFDFKLEGVTTDDSSTENRLDEISSKIDSIQQKLTQSQENLSPEQFDRLQKELEVNKEIYEKELNEAIEEYDEIENDQLWKAENDSTIDDLRGVLAKNSSESKIQELLSQQKEIADKKNLSKKDKDKLNKIESELKAELGKLNSEAIDNLKKEFILQREDALLTLDKAIENGSKYDILDKDNAFDFPDDTGIKDSFKDRANEEKIVAEHFENLNTQPQSSDEVLNILGVTKDETNLDEYVSKLAQENIEKNIAKDKEFESLYNKLASNEEKLQKEREKLQAAFEKQAEIAAKDLTQKDKKELAKLEQDMSSITENINKLQKEQQETVDKILDKERNPDKKAENSESIKDKITNFFSKKDKTELNKKEYEKTENGFIRKESEVKKQLDTVLNSGKDIPAEHLQDFVAKLLTDKESKNMGNDANTIKNEKLDNKTQEDFDRLEKIYNKIPNNFETTRVQMNKELVNNLVNDSRLTDIVFGGIDTPEAQKELVARYEKNPQEVLQSALDGNYMKEGVLTDSDLVDLVGIIQDNRKPVFEKYTGTDFKPADIEITDFSNGNAAQYGDGKIKIDTDTVDSLSKALDSVLHESTHLEQDLIRKDKNTKVAPSVQELYDINYSEGGYIKPTISKDNRNEYSAGDVVYNQGYKKQPIEAEAFNSMNGTQIVKESLDKLVAKLKKEQALENFELKNSDSNELQNNTEITTPKKNNNNLESNTQDNSLGNLPLIYGTSGGREELAEAVKNSPNKNNIIADGYLNMLNKGGDFENLNNFAEKVATGTLTSADIDKIINFTDNSVNENSPYFEKDANKVSTEANRELIEDLLKNPETTKVLKELYEANEALKKDIDDEDAQDKYDDALFDFFELKTNTVLEKTLEKNGQIYFSLNEIVMNDFKKVDFDKLLDVFNPMNPNYPSVTSGELRVALSKYLDNPNLKFLLGKQVIELPQDIKDKIKDIVKKNEAIKNTSSNEIKKEQPTQVEDRFAVLDKDNAFDFPKADDSRDEIIDMVSEGKIVADHYQDLEGLPRRKSTREPNVSAPLKGSVIVDGTRQDKPQASPTIDKKGNIREEAIISNPIKTSEIFEIKKPIEIGGKNFDGLSTDSFLGNITSPQNREQLEALAKEFHTNGIDSSSLDKVFKTDINGIPSAVNKELVSTIVGSQLGAQGLSKIHQATVELNTNPNNQIAKEKLNEGLKEFELAKTEAILDIMLGSGNKAYISIGNTVTNASGNIDLNKIYDIFNPNSPNFDSKEANELRYIFKKHSDNPNLKFTIGNQVIELPSAMKNILVNAAINKKVIVTDTANEPKIVAEHYEALEGLPRKKSIVRRDSIIGNPIRNSSNLEGTSSNNTNSTLVFGSDSSKKALKNSSESSPNKNNTDPNNYLASLNKGENRKELVDLANKFTSGNIDIETIDKVVNYKEGSIDGDIFSHPDTPQNRIPSEENRAILEKILGSQLGAEALAKISQATKELEANPNDKIAKEKLEDAMKEFDTAKSIAILDKTLTENGQVYLPITDIVKAIDGQINLEKVFEVFNKENPDYNSKTTTELRVALEKHLNNPNLKLVIEKQVIELPTVIKDKITSITKGNTLKEGTRNKENKNKVKETKGKVEETSTGTIITRGSKDLKNNLELVSKNLDNIPTEHLTDYLGKVVGNSEYNKISNSAGKDTVKILNPAINNDKKSVDNLNKIYENIYSKNDTSFRARLNDDYISRLKNSKEIKDILKNGEVNEENIRKLANIVGNLKQESFKEVVGKNYEKANLVIKKGDKNTDNGNLSGNTLTLYVKPDRTLEDYLGTISHEYTHNDQQNLKVLDPDKAENKNIEYLYSINASNNGYINPTVSLEGYKNQPVEKEAFDLQKKVLDELNKKKLKNNNNLESNVQDKSLGNTPIIYGTKNGRRELVKVSENSLNKNPTVADAYLGKLNLGYYYVHLSDFAQKYAEGTLTKDDVNKIANFSDPYFNETYNYIDKQINKVDSEANKELLNEILKNKKAIEALKTIASLKDEIIKKPNKNNDEKYQQAVVDFMTEKTKTVIDKTFEKDGQLYFSLDEIISDRDDNIDFNNLLKIYSSDSKYYDSVTSAELRLVFDKYLDNPNLKFTLGKQVIELPQNIKNKIKDKIDFEKKFELLDSDNAFDFSKDDGIRDSFKDTADEPKIVAEHYEPLGAPPVKLEKTIEISLPENKSTKNIENNNSDNSFGSIPLIYGTTFGRKDLDQATAESPNKNNTLADSFLGKLSIGANYEQMSDFAQKVINQQLTSNDINDIISYKETIKRNDDIIFPNTDINKVSSEANKIILEKLLSSEKANEALKSFVKAQEKLKVEPSNLEAKKEIINAVKSFNELKTIIVLEESLKKGTPIYFSLNQIITNNEKDIDFTKLYDVFDKNNRYYDSVTSAELRTIFKNYLENPNLKFFINKQIIEIPKEIKNNLNQLANKNSTEEALNISQKKKYYNENSIEKNEIKISEYITTEGFQQKLDNLKEKILEKYGADKRNELDETLNLNEFQIKKEVEEYLHKVLSEEKITLTQKELDSFLSKASDKFLKELDNHYNGFTKQVVQGDTLFTRSEEGVKKQLEIVAKDINNIPSEHLQNFLANLFLNKDARSINESVTAGNISIIKNKEINLDDDSNKYLYSIYEKIPNKFADERKKLDDLIVAELGKSEFLTDLITDGGEITPQDFKEAYKEAPQVTIDKIYNLDVSNMDIKDIEDILDDIQNVRQKYFESTTGVKYQKSDLVFVDHLSGNGHTQVAFHDPETNTIYISQEKITTLGKLIDIFLHETQHNEQDLISTDINSDKISSEIKELYAINGQGYINPEKEHLSLLDRVMYQGQFVEKEAFDIMRGQEIIKALVESYIDKEDIKTLTHLNNERKTELEMYQPDDEKPGTSMDTTPAPPKNLSAREIVNSPAFHEAINKMKLSMIQKYGVQTAKIINEELNLNNPKVIDRLKIDLDNEMAKLKVPITDANLTSFLNQLLLKNLKLQKEKTEEYKLMEGFGGKVFLRTEDGIRKQLEIVAKNRDKIPPEHLQEFLANIFMNKEARKIQNNGIEGKFMVANNLKLDKTYVDDLNIHVISEKISNKFAGTRKEMDNLIISELGNSEYLKNFITQDGILEKDVLKDNYIADPNFTIDKIYSLNVKNIPDESLIELLTEIERARGKYFEAQTGLKYTPSKVKIINKKIGPNEEVATHNTATGTITINKNSITTLGYLIDILLHESQHHEQGIIALSEEKGKINEESKELYNLGHFTYIDGKRPTEHSMTMYKSQLVEKEAFDIMRTKEILKNIVENIIK